jgi:hypothetical protein
VSRTALLDLLANVTGGEAEPGIDQQPTISPRE